MAAPSVPQVVLFYPRPWPGTGMAGRLPYALMHLQAYLRKAGVSARIVDERTEPDLPSLIRSLDPATVCFGISTFTGIQITNALRIAESLRQAHPGVPIVWGGWHPSCAPEQTARHPLVDIVVRGQGEAPFKELIDALLQGTPLETVKGISFKREGAVVSNPDRPAQPVIEDLRLDYSAVDTERYISPQPWGERSLGMLSSLGCPFSCTFCAIHSVYKARTFYRRTDILLDEIDHLVERYGIQAITFDDDNFLLSPRRVEEFCVKLLRKPYRIAWDASAHVGPVLKLFDDRLMALVKESGCRQIYIGAESGSDEVLALLNKKATAEQNLEFVRKMRKAGMRSFLSCMAFIPGTSGEDIYDTMRMLVRARDIDPAVGYRLFYYTPYPATVLYQRALAMGMAEPASLEAWSHHTLRKFKAPWIKDSHRKLVRYFHFYYFPYSRPAEADSYLLRAHGGPVMRSLRFAYSMIFQNPVLKWLARWRIRHFWFRFPIDAWIVMQGEKVKNLYSRIFLKTTNLFADYED